MKRTLALTITLLLACPMLWAQGADTSGWHMHLSTGTSVGTGFGRTQSLSWVAPSFEFHPTSRLTVNTGFAAAGSLLPADFSLKGYGDRSLAPRREGTRLHALWAEAEYQVNDRLWLWGAVAHVSGIAQPLWLDHSVPLQATAFSGGFRYAVADRSLFEMHFHIVKDNGQLGPMGLVGPMGLMGSMGALDSMWPLDL